MPQPRNESLPWNCKKLRSIRKNVRGKLDLYVNSAENGGLGSDMGIETIVGVGT